MTTAAEKFELAKQAQWVRSRKRTNKRKKLSISPKNHKVKYVLSKPTKRKKLQMVYYWWHDLPEYQLL